MNRWLSAAVKLAVGLSLTITSHIPPLLLAANTAVAIIRLTERSHSWSSAHDWKSCTPKGVAGSNPALSAFFLSYGYERARGACGFMLPGSRLKGETLSALEFDWKAKSSGRRPPSSTRAAVA